MEEIVVDVLVIGWGKGGKTLAGSMGRTGRRVALVEQSDRMYGGSCINIACVPTKDLVHSAETRRDSDDPQAWFADAVQGRDALTDKLRARNYAMLAEMDTVTVIDGRARFTGPHDVEVMAGDERLNIHAETIVINTGTIPAPPTIDGASGSARVFDSTTIQHVDPLPKHLAIIGGGYVGLEFAGMFSHFGSKVTVISRSERVLPREDRDVSEAVHAMLLEKGVEFHFSSVVERLVDNPDDGSVGLDVVTAGHAANLSVDAVLVATGRQPTTGDLGLADGGIAVDANGFVMVDERLRTSVPGVYAVGDVNGGPQFTYISLDDNRIVLNQLTGDGQRSTADRVAVPSTIFLTPPLARVGINEAQARASGRHVLVASKKVADIAAMPRPKIIGETHGVIKFVVDPQTDLILGATVFSIDAQELVNLIALAMRADITATALRNGIWTHPSSTEALNEVLADLADYDPGRVFTS